MKKNIGILNGPNLDRLGIREPAVYGSNTLRDLESGIARKAETLGIAVECFQSNHEGELIEKITEWTDRGFRGLIINLGAYSHTSIALRDAISGSQLPTVEVHISNIHTRETFRHHSYTASVCLGIISGLGFDGYSFALEFLNRKTGDDSSHGD